MEEQNSIFNTQYTHYEEIINEFYEQPSALLPTLETPINIHEFDESINSSFKNGNFDIASTQENIIIADISESSGQPNNNNNMERAINNTFQLDEAKLRSLLSQWNLEYLNDVCLGTNNISLIFFIVVNKYLLFETVDKYNNLYYLFCIVEQKISVDILKIIKLHHIERLLRGFDLGTQIIFEHKLEEWRELIKCPLDTFCLPDSRKRDFINKSPTSISPTDSLNTTPTSVRFMPYDRSSTNENSCTIMLSTILSNSSRGKGLVDYYNKFSSFHEDQRSVLIFLIAQYYEEKGVKMSLTASYQLEQQILERFPSEKLVIYKTLRHDQFYIFIF